MLFEAFYAEQLFANWLAIIPGRLRLRTSKDTMEKSVQNNLSTARGYLEQQRQS